MAACINLELQSWVKEQTDEATTITPLAGDASFRRYYRALQADANTMIAVDASLEKAINTQFVRIAQHWRACGVHTPKIIAYNEDAGFLLIEDLGNIHYLDAITPENSDTLYTQAMDALLHIQNCDQPADYKLPVYDESLLNQELQLFSDWFLTKYLGLAAEQYPSNQLLELYQLLVHNALAQPSTTVHRDYHSRNLMVTNNNVPGIIDFQDAVKGPITYDLVSLLKDCYVAWPTEKVHSWVKYYYQQASQAQQIHSVSFEQFIRWFDWMGIQRHLKAIGIFARLHQRDNKTSYVHDIPRCLNYIQSLQAQYPELSWFIEFIDEKIVTLLKEKLAIT